MSGRTEASDLLLAEAKEALRRGRSRRALRLAWEAGLRAAARNDDEGLAQTIELAEEVRDHTTGRVRKDAASLAAYCVFARANPAEHGLGWLRSPLRR